MAEYYDMKDKMRRSAQDEQAMRMRPVPFSPEIEGAPMIRRGEVTEPDVVNTVKGAGGYEYAELSDGSFKITKSPGANVGKIVKPGMAGYDAIKAEVSGEKPPAPAAPRTGSMVGDRILREAEAAPRTGSMVGDRILGEADVEAERAAAAARPARSAPPLAPRVSPREMQERIASSTNPTYRQMVGETQGPQIRATMGKDLTEAFAFMGQNPEMARTNAEALLGAYEKAGDPTVLRAIQSIIAARAAR
jgi:hypothetical protein